MLPTHGLRHKRIVSIFLKAIHLDSVCDQQSPRTGGLAAGLRHCLSSSRSGELGLESGPVEMDEQTCRCTVRLMARGWPSTLTGKRFAVPPERFSNLSQFFRVTGSDNVLDARFLQADFP